MPIGESGGTSGGVADRLRTARREAGISTRKVAERLNLRGLMLSHSTIANYELGKSRPPLPVLALLAELYQKQLAWFMTGSTVLTRIRYRALKSVKASDKNLFQTRAERVLNAFVRLEEALSAQLRNELHDFRARRGQRGRDLARQLRERLGLGDAPVPSVIGVLEKFGIHVIDVETDSRIDACAATFAGQKVVVLNRNLSNDRVRLNAAHELGHLLYEDGGDDSFVQGDEMEARAFEFASNLLLPEAKLKAAFTGYSMVRLVSFKEEFGVSLAAMIYRAEKARLLSENLSRRLWIEFARRGWRQKEPGTVLPDRPRRFECLLDESTRDGVLTWSRASRITGMPEKELRSRLSAACERS